MTAFKKISVTAASALALSVAVASHATEYVEGKDYFTLKNAEKIDTNRIIVREFFWYGCPHCYHLDAYAQKWEKTKPKDVVFFHTPAALNPVWEHSARGYYAAQALGVDKKAHAPLFHAVQEKGQQLFDQNSLANFYAQYGADKKKFNDLYNSFSVGTKIGRSKAAAVRYQLTGVPAVVVQGKYVVKGSDAKVFQVVDYLVDKVRKEGLVNK